MKQVESKILFQYDKENYFFIRSSMPYEDVCLCMCIPLFFHAPGCHDIIVHADGLALYDVIDLFKNKIVAALLAELEIKESCASMRYKAHQVDVAISQALATNTTIPSDDIGWIYAYQLAGMSTGASSWIYSYDNNIYIEVFSAGVTSEADMPCARIMLSREQAKAWIVTAYELMESMAAADDMVIQRSVEEQIRYNRVMGG